MTRVMRARATGGVEAVAFDDLSDSEFTAWHSLRDTNPQLDSPYFHPEFARAVHESGAPVQVVVERDDEGVHALLPGHRVGSRFRPVGWPGADFQGPITRAGVVVDPLRLLRATGLRSLEFDHLVEIPGFEPWIESRRGSPYLDVTGGLDGYLSRASRSGKDNMSQARRKTRKAEAAHGPIDFVAASTEHDVLDTVIELKRAQYAATGARDYFAASERVALLHRLLETRVDGFAGVLSTVRVGHRLLGAHFGIRSEDVLHWWFPVYDPGFAAFAPGWILLRELTAAAPSLGVTRIDLGRGDDEYKRRAKTGESTVCQGLVSESRVTLTTHRLKSALIDVARSSPVVRRVRRSVRGR